MLNIVQKALERKEFMLQFLFNDQPMEFRIDHPDIAWLYSHGVIDNLNGLVAITVPLYAKRLVKAFAPLTNGETVQYLTTANDTLGHYLHADGRLNVSALLFAYRAYVRRRGYRAFDTENLREAACHYSLDGYVAFFIEQLGGQTYVEIPSGRGRIDILIRYRDETNIIETKVYTTMTAFKRGKAQLAAYLRTEGVAEGYYVVFSRFHTDADEMYTNEELEGVCIHTHIIPTTFERPSEAAVPETLRER